MAMKGFFFILFLFFLREAVFKMIKFQVCDKVGGLTIALSMMKAAEEGVTFQ